MSSKFKILSLKLRSVIFVCLLFSVVFQLNCSIPNLESQDCTDARNTVKELYSYHFGNDLKFTKENLKQREKYLTEELKKQLENQPESAIDYFTATDDYPKAFRLGKCAVVEPDKKVNIQVVLFWKTETRSEQKEVQVETVKQNNDWLVNKVESK